MDYQINATANNGDSGALNGTFHICDYLEKLYQPPDSNKVEKVCPPSKGAAWIDYAAWFANFLVAPVRTLSYSKARRIPEAFAHLTCVGTMERQVRREDSRRRKDILLADGVRPPMPSVARWSGVFTGRLQFSGHQRGAPGSEGSKSIGRAKVTALATGRVIHSDEELSIDMNMPSFRVYNTSCPVP